MSDEEVIEADLEDSGSLTVKAFYWEYRQTHSSGLPLTGRAFSHDEVREVLIDLLDKLSWIADAADVRQMEPYANRIWDEEDFARAGFNEGLDKYQQVILETKKGLEDLA